MSALDIIGKLAVGIVEVTLVLLLVALYFGFGAAVGGMVGYGTAIIYNWLLALSLDPMLAAAFGSIVGILAGGGAAASSGD